MVFQKGESGNPLGAALHQRDFTAMLRVACSAIDRRTRKTKLRLIAEKATTLALNGDMRAIEFIADRLEGKPVARYINPDVTPPDPERDERKVELMREMIQALNDKAAEKARRAHPQLINAAPKPRPALPGKLPSG